MRSIPPAYTEVLKQISALSARYQQNLQPPCTHLQLLWLMTESRITLGMTPPTPYLEFLKLHNGLDWDGLSVYSAQRSFVMGSSDAIIGGFVEENRIRREVPDWKNYLAFADTGDDCCCLRLADHRYLLLDAVSLDVIEQYRSFDDMIAVALRKRL